MKQVGTFIGVVVMGLLVGCGPVGPEEAGGQELTPEQLAELVARAEPDAQLHQGLTAVCQPTTTNSCVNAGYGSCASWSGFYDCGDLSACNELGCPRRVCYGTTRDSCTTVYDGSSSQGTNRYRVCFNAAGESCTEYEKSSRLICGC
jgi:hypothetical protein